MALSNDIIDPLQMNQLQVQRFWTSRPDLTLGELFKLILEIDDKVTPQDIVEALSAEMDSQGEKLSTEQMQIIGLLNTRLSDLQVTITPNKRNAETMSRRMYAAIMKSETILTLDDLEKIACVDSAGNSLSTKDNLQVAEDFREAKKMVAERKDIQKYTKDGKIHEGKGPYSKLGRVQPTTIVTPIPVSAT